MFSSKQEWLANWGNYPRHRATVYRADKAAELAAIEAPFIARGLGRCYGDSSLADHVFAAHRWDEVIDFDATKGFLRAGAGISLAAILRLIVPHGWFLLVTPGTAMITLGGAIASDVHGKNHHADGCFSASVLRFSLATSGQRLLEVSATENSDWFQATCGGMGLTGVIVEASIRLRRINSSYIWQRVDKAPNLETIMQRFNERSAARYSVAWIDCLARGKNLGRSVLMSGDFAPSYAVRDIAPDKRLQLPRPLPLAVPFHLPSATLNRYTISAFNRLYYGKAKNTSLRVDYAAFFYPLDAIARWNRIYGRRGFSQYQFILPLAESERGLEAILAAIAAARAGSFLAVLKLYGPENDNWLSFPLEGYSLALDFPINGANLQLFEQLDELVLKYGGRLYLTKDARVSAAVFAAGYPRLEQFRDFRRSQGLEMFQSLQAQRLEL
jgi:decaprenylphospho-beta-D-ribofuranose 2-oxidase